MVELKNAELNDDELLNVIGGVNVGTGSEPLFQHGDSVVIDTGAETVYGTIFGRAFYDTRSIDPRWAYKVDTDTGRRVVPETILRKA